MQLPYRRIRQGLLLQIYKTLVAKRFCSQVTGSGIPYETSYASKNVSKSNEVPHQADVVIIGGGSLGCQTLYHLAKLGVTDVVLLEKSALTAGTTWHTAGLVWNLRPSDTTISLLKYMVSMMPKLEAETDMDIGWINNGGLFIANNKERLDEYKRLMTIGKSMGVESHILDPTQVLEVHPLLNTADMYGSLYSPADGTIDPAGLCSALSRAARRLGAKVIEGCDVTAIETTECDGVRKINGVVTSSGKIKTDTVVNAAGAWGNYVAAMVGEQIPLTSMKHAYVVTEKIDGIKMTPNVRDHDASVYLKLQGDALSIGGYEYNPDLLDKVDRNFAFGLYDLDWNIFGCHIEGAINRIPALKTTGIKSSVCGPESFTPDHNPIMGHDPRVRGLFHNCGFNSSGMMLGGGCGWQAAEWIVHGRPSLDMYSFDIRRFNPKLSCNVKWVRERSHESYVKNYSTVFVHDEPLAGRNQRIDPLHQELLEKGCQYQERQGWERPGWFSRHTGATPPLNYDWYGAYNNQPHQHHPYYHLLKNEYSFEFPQHHEIIKQECISCRQSAAVFNMSYFGKYYITGPDAQRAVDWIFSNDLRKPEGSVVYTCMLNKNGGIEADLTVTVLTSGAGGVCDPTFEGRGFYVAVGGGFAEHVRAHMAEAIHNNKFRAVISDQSEHMGLLSIQGPNSRQILQKLTSADLDNEAFPFGTSKMVKISEFNCRALRVSFVGELGWELHVSSDDLLQVYKLIKQAGKDLDLVDAGYRALDSLSAEKGYKHWHADIRPDDSPQEAGLMFTCKLKTDVNFEGRAAVEARRVDGLRRKLITLTTDHPLPMWGLEGIVCDGQNVGFVRRVEQAFTLDTMIAYGYASMPDGSKVTNAKLEQHSWSVDVMGEQVPAHLHIKHPFDPKGSRLLGKYDGVASQV